MGKRIMNVELGLLPWRVLNLGYVGENEHTQIVIDCTEVLLDYPQATCSMVVKPPRGDLYPVMPTKSGNTFIWEITASDVVYAGSGQIQLTFYNGEEIIRSDIGSTKVAASLETTGDAPEPLQNWMDAAEQTAAQIAEAAAEGVVDDLADAKDEAIAAIEAKGQEVIEDIPSDYSELSDDVDDLKSALNDIESAIKWTDEATDMLDSIGSAIPFTSPQGGEMWNNLISILRGTFISHSVLWSGSNYSASNTSTHIADEASYSCIVTPSEGFIISALTVTMGNTAIIPTQNQDGTYTITIASVTDDVIISVTTILDPSALIYHVENLVCDGTQSPIETSLEFSSSSANGVTDDWTICAKAIISEKNQYRYVFVAGNLGVRLSFDSYVPDTSSRIRMLGAYEVNSQSKTMLNQEVGVVITHVANSKDTLTCYYINKSDELVKNTPTFGGINALDVANDGTPLCVGARKDGTYPFVGTINELSIHHRVLSDQEAEAYLRGGNI